MVDKAPVDIEAAEAELLKDPKIKDFDELVENLARQIAGKATLLPKSQFDLKLDAFKALTAYKAVKNREPEPAQNSILEEMRQALENDAPPVAPESEGDAAESDEPEETHDE